MEMFTRNRQQIEKDQRRDARLRELGYRFCAFLMEWFSQHQTFSQKRYVGLSNPHPALRAALSRRERGNPALMLVT